MMKYLASILLAFTAITMAQAQKSPYRRWWMGGCRLGLASEPAVDGSARQHTHRGAIDPCRSV